MNQRRGFEKLNCETSHLSLFRGDTPKIEKLILEQDVLYVGGGNTRNLITLWKNWGLDKFIHKAYKKGTILAGISAGSICWFEQGLTDSIPGSLTSLKCLGWLKGSNCPHYDGEVERRPSYHRLLAKGLIKPGLATEDSVCAHYQNEKLIEVVNSVAGKRAYNLTKKAKKVIESPIEPRFLGAKQ
jgi:dipeptidase E